MSDAARHTEQRDVNGRMLALFAVGLMVFVLLILLAVTGAFRGLVGPIPFGSGTGLATRNVPVLQVGPRLDRIAYDAEKARLRDSYGWDDRAAGFARVPVGEAMRIIADRGVPDWGQRSGSTGCEAVPRAPSTTCSASATGAR
jgi:hypothetical protein